MDKLEDTEPEKQKGGGLDIPGDMVKDIIITRM